ncbi:hypothetical protein KY362_06840 [Candidatus Woesearchaeota archaeon]|nr:hypothetical protein [Candidatus Woesearchaeota archaeon]
MIKDILNLNRGRKKPRPPKPVKEKVSKTVSSERFNDMIDYYTAELKSRLKEIDRLKEENEMLIKTSIRNAARSDEFRQQVQKLSADLRETHSREGPGK